MAKRDPDLELATKWFRKLDRPSSATARLAHARDDPDKRSRRPFRPEAVLKRYRATSRERMERLKRAVKLINK